MNGADAPPLHFIDTNVLVYAFDRSAPAKQRIAQELVATALETRRGLISTQVVQEFMNLALRKFAQPMTIEECRDYHRAVLLPLCRYFPSISTYEQALSVVEETKYSLYDALIITAALESGCQTLFTEDLQHGQKFRSLTIINPFADLPAN